LKSKTIVNIQKEKEIASIKKQRVALITDLVTGKRKVDNICSVADNGLSIVDELLPPIQK
jgi:hypothetical protein